MTVYCDKMASKGHPKGRATVSQEIRRAIDVCGLSRYRICLAAGVNEAVMSRFMAGKRALHSGTVDALADALGLEVIVPGPDKIKARICYSAKRRSAAKHELKAAPRHGGQARRAGRRQQNEHT